MKQRDNVDLDEVIYLMGDEDGGVGSHCRICDRGGLPIVYCTYSGDQGYNHTDVIIVYTFSTFTLETAKHFATHVGDSVDIVLEQINR